MTERKPPGVSFETWLDRQVREATERGEFDNLPGTGKPIADLEQPRDELWWIRQKLRRENVSYLPPTLALRKEAEDAMAAASRAASEAEVRRIVGAINDKIRAANRLPTPGPPLNLVPFDVEDAVSDWRARRADEVAEAAPTAGHPEVTGVAGAAGSRARTRRLWRRRAR
jgi:hypothetical protein